MEDMSQFMSDTRILDAYDKNEEVDDVTSEEVLIV